MRKKWKKKISSLETRIVQLECSHKSTKIIKTHKYYINPNSYEYTKKCQTCGKRWFVTEKEYLQFELDEANKSCKTAGTLRKQIKELKE